MGELPKRAVALALLVTVGGAVPVALAVGAVPLWGLGDVAAALLLTAALAAAQRMSVAFRLGNQTEYFSVTDPIWLTGVLVVAPSVIVLAAVVGTVVGQGLLRFAPIKVAFNAGMVALSVGAATAVYGGLGRPSVLEPRAWVAASAAMLACFLINLLTVAAMLSVVQELSFLSVLMAPIKADLFYLAASIALGVITSVVWVASPYAVLFLLLFLSLLFLAYRGGIRSAQESEHMEEIARTADDIATEGDFATRLPISAESDRLGRLAATLNRMLDRVQSAFERERRFMREAGHELRTPITICRGHVEVLSLKPGEEELEETVTLLLDEFDRMGRILEDLSSIELSEHPNFVRPSEFALKPFVEEVARKVRPFLGDRLTVHSTLNGEAIRADPQRLTQALLNLLQNAAVHADPDAGVEFRVREEPGVIRFEVADSGGGVPAGKEDAVFRPFYRISHVRPGSGLGLALVRSIAEAHGGAAGVENAPGVGATFWLTVPR